MRLESVSGIENTERVAIFAVVYVVAVSTIDAR